MADDGLIFKVPAAVGAPMLVAGPSPRREEEERLAPSRSADRYELAHAHESAVWRATGTEEPVFLDRSGRRRPLLGVAGAGAGLLAATWLAALVTGAIGFSNLPVSAAVPAVAGRAPAAGHSTRLLAAAPARAHRRLLVDIDRPRAQRDVDTGHASNARAIRV